MPHVFGAMLFTAGLYAGMVWLGRVMARQAEEAARFAEEMQRKPSAASAPKDLGTLEFDAAEQVYKPAQADHRGTP